MRHVIPTPHAECQTNPRAIRPPAARRAAWLPGTLVPALVLALMALAGCTGFAQAEREAAQETQARDRSGDVALLYKAMVNLHAQRQLPVEVASPEVRLVATPFVEIEPGLRRRYISRIVEFPGGVALKVTAEFQSLMPAPAPEPLPAQNAQGPQPPVDAAPLAATTTWQASEQPEILERAAREELELGRAIEREFLRLKKG